MTEQLEGALVALQKLEKKLRQLRNRDEVAWRDVDEAKEALDLVRAIADRHGIETIDLDSRAERHKRKEKQ